MAEIEKKKKTHWGKVLLIGAGAALVGLYAPALFPAGFIGYAATLIGGGVAILGGLSFATGTVGAIASKIAESRSVSKAEKQAKNNEKKQAKKLANEKKQALKNEKKQAKKLANEKKNNLLNENKKLKEQVDNSNKEVEELKKEIAESKNNYAKLNETIAGLKQTIENSNAKIVVKAPVKKATNQAGYIRSQSFTKIMQKLNPDEFKKIANTFSGYAEKGEVVNGLPPEAYVSLAKLLVKYDVGKVEGRTPDENLTTADMQKLIVDKAIERYNAAIEKEKNANAANNNVQQVNPVVNQNNTNTSSTTVVNKSNFR